MKKIHFLSAGLLLFIAGCAHTNELAKYDLSNTKVIFQEDILPPAKTINVSFHDPSPEISSTNKKDDKKDEKKESTLLNVLTDIGTGILSADKVDKLQEAIKTEDLINQVTNGMKGTMVTFMNVIPAMEMSENPSFIIKSVLQTCDLYVTDKKISVKLQAESTIYDKSTGAIVWSNIESDVIPVTTSDLSSDLKTNKNETKILTAVQFAALSDERVNQIVGLAAETVGRNMAEQLRQDFAESKMKK